jgi:putative tricarboxylic transport membrane protein
VSAHGRTPSAAPERWIGVVLLLLAIAAAWLARGYRVSFIADPVGPRAFPLLGAALIAIGAARMLVRPAVRAVWPTGGLLARLAAAAAVLALYPLVLPLLGFITATGALMWALALLFGGRGIRALVIAVLIAAAMYALFVYALGVPLPIGRLFLKAG